MLWLVAGLPLAAVAAGVTLIAVLAAGGKTDVLSPAVRRTAQVQVEDIRADETALRKGLGATLQRRMPGGGLDLELRGDAGGEAPLRLRLLHPATAAYDSELQLERIDAQHWRSAQTPASTHAWHVRVEPADGRWRLAGRLEPEAERIELEPLWRR
ncbi:MAG: FixH family protein [Rhodanobacteraceae bacterium]|nr:FixH family protein [Rhodanobacteraceae bacterium]